MRGATVDMKICGLAATLVLCPAPCAAAEPPLSVTVPNQSLRLGGELYMRRRRRAISGNSV